MTKVFKITGRTIGILLEWTLILVIILAFAIRSTPFQTFLGKQATAYLSKELKTTVKVDYVSILFLDEASLDGVLILDQDKDTLLYAKHLFATFDEINLRKRTYKLGEVEAADAFIHIKRDTTGGTNLDFIKDYFIKPKKKKKKNIFSLKAAKLTNTRFQYDDASKDRKEYGIDYGHINAFNINVEIDDINYKDDIFTGQITELNLDEISGFHLSKLNALASVSKNGIELSDVKIKTESSSITSSKFNLVSKTFTSFKYFVDSVKFDGKIDRSIVDLVDVAYFAPALKGMCDTVRLTTKISNNVNNLRFDEFYLRYLNNTAIKGTFKLIDFKKFESEFFHEKITYAYLDLNEIEKLTLPDKASSKHINISDRLKKLGFVQSKNIILDGIGSQFVISADNIRTDLGSAKLKNGIKFAENESTGLYDFWSSKNENITNDIHIAQFKLGQLIGNKDIGIVDGKFSLQGTIKASDDIVFESIKGDVNRFDYRDYGYTNIRIEEGSYMDQEFIGKVDVEDDYLNLTYDGRIDFKGRQEMDFKINLTKAFLDNLNLAKKDSKLASYFDVDIIGKNTKDMAGRVELHGLVYMQNGKEIDLDNVVINVVRKKDADEFRITSSLADVELIGKVDFETLINAFEYQFAKLFPSLMKEQKIRNFEGQADNFFYKITLKNTDDFFNVFYPDLKLSQGTELKGYYDGSTYNFTLDISANLVKFRDYNISNVSLIQLVDSNSVMGNYHAGRVDINDSIHFDDIYFTTNGGLNQLTHELSWEGNTKTPSHIGWHTTLNDWNDYAFLLEPSYFYIKDHRWDIAHESSFKVRGDTIEVGYFELTREEQMILIDGKISSNRSDHLNFKINDLEIDEVAGFISSDYAMSGKLNGWGYLVDPLNNIEYMGDAALIDFHVNNQEVGDVFMQSEWDHEAQSISAQGDLIYQGNQTFDFDGHYYLDRESDNLDFDLIFDYTDIQFANAFLDPDVMSEVRGILIGSLQLGGTVEHPELSGSVNLAGGSTYIDLLGVHFGIDGPIEVDEYGFYMNNIPVFDEEGNAGYLIGSIYHDNFKDFNFDLQFDLERDAINKDPLYSWKVVPLEKFLMMNAAYSPDYQFYGKGYGTGLVNIFGYTKNLEITVNVKAVKGTEVSIPLYGVGELEEENDFIIWDDSVSLSQDLNIPKINFSGVNLDLNFEVTPDADLRIVFDEEINDVLTANGYGDMSIRLDNFGAIRMDGLFTIDHGIYNFAMAPVKGMLPIKQKFFLEKGGTINWTGDPYDANLNLSAFYKVNANIADISQDIITTGGGAHQPVQCYMYLTESMLKPTIKFDIKAPQANDLARQLIARVTSEQDELNRQFFSLLAWKKFQPISGTYGANASAATDLITNQINTLLSQVSNDYKMNVSIQSDQTTGNKQYEFGVTKNFLDDRLILSGSFGVENFQSETSDNQNNLIGDINLEYLLNESGTFRVQVFNESTDKTIIQQNDLGRFTQGAGISYKEDFNTLKDFKLIQYVFDVFRKEENKRYPWKRKKQQRPVPVDSPATRNNFRRSTNDREA